MNPTNVANWTDPRSWPFPIYIWLGAVVFAVGNAAYRQNKQRRANAWPTAEAHIDSVQIDNPKILFFKDTNRHAGIISYSYSAMGSNYSGRYSRAFRDKGTAEELIRDLEGKRVTVHFNPDKPSDSVLTDLDLELLIQSRPEAAENLLPEWLRLLLWPGILVSAAGLTLSIWVHGAALLGKRVGGYPLFITLHVMSIALGLLSIPVMKSSMSKRIRKRHTWKDWLSGAPAWMRYTAYFFWAYAILNFLTYMFALQQPNTGRGTSAADWRGFSGHWMAFYSAEMATFYAAVARTAKTPKCLSGHTVRANSTFCPKCGQPVIREQ